MKEQKSKAKMALESLIAQCVRELRNLEQFSDKRMLVATADLAYHYAVVVESAENLEDAFEEAQQPEREEESGYDGRDRDEWKHEAAAWQRLK